MKNKIKQMKKVFLVATLVLIAGLAFSQSPLPVGKSQLNLGVGLSGWGVPIYIGLDHSVHKDITIGGELSYSNYRENNNKHNITGFSGNANYHFNTILDIPQVWDFYAGLNIGYFVWSSPDGYVGKYSSRMV